MSFNAGSVEGHLDLDAKGFVSALRRAQGALDRIDKNSKKAAGGFSKLRNALSLLRDMMLVVPGLLRGITAPLKALTGFLRGSSDAAAEFEKSVRGLSTAMVLAGARDVPRLVDEFQVFASELQNTTEFSDGLTVEVGKLLTIFGLQGDQLKMAVKATLDYAAATGQDALAAARQFGQTLGGTIGTLGRYFPAARDLTEVQLKAAGAFKLAGELVGGFAEQVAKTTAGLRAQFINAFGDLQKAVGFAINPVIDVITKAATEALQQFTATINDNRGRITDAFRGIASGVLDVIRKIASTALDIPVWTAQAKQFIAEIVSAAKVGTLDLGLMLRGVFLDLRAEVAAFVESLSAIPGFGAALIEPANQLKASVSEARTEMVHLARNVEAIKAPWIEAAAAAAKAAEEAKTMAAGIRDGSIQGGKLAAAYRRITGFLDQAQQNLANTKDTTADLEGKSNSWGTSLNKRLGQLREITGITKETADATGGVTAGVQAATAATADLKQEAQGAADAFGQIGRAAGGDGGRGGDFKPGETRRKGGRAGLDLDDPFAAVQALQAQELQLRATGGGLYGRLQRRSARAATEQIRAAAEATVDRAFKEYTASLLSELSSAGITDPTARQQYIQDRLAEAQRFGVLPQRHTTVGVLS